MARQETVRFEAQDPHGATYEIVATRDLPDQDLSEEGKSVYPWVYCYQREREVRRESNGTYTLRDPDTAIVARLTSSDERRPEP